MHMHSCMPMCLAVQGGAADAVGTHDALRKLPGADGEDTAGRYHAYPNLWAHLHWSGDIGL